MAIPLKLVVLGAVLAVVARNILDTLRPFQALPPTNDNGSCKLYEGPTGAEDFVVTKHGWIISSSLDGAHLLENGVNACQRNTGGLWAFSPHSRKPPLRMEIEGLPQEVKACFMTHGIFLSEATNRLYAVTHHGDYSSVQVFSVGYSQDDDNMPTLSWVRSITSDSFLNMSPNSVVEGVNQNEIYVTQCLPFAIPKHGRHHPESFKERIQQVLLIPILFVGIKLSTVQHCIFSDNINIPATCSQATNFLKFRAANGITISNNRRTIIVNDLFSRALLVLERQYDSGDGTLLHTDTIHLTYAVDNIEWKLSTSGGGQEEIYMGTIPNLMVAASRNHQGKNLLEQDYSNVPGGLAVVTKSKENGKWGEQRIVYNHDGSILSQVSFGMKLNDDDKKIVLLGSPHANGILVCDDDDETLFE